MPQKQLILHVGFHKSGTTALQESFFAQRKELEDQGVLYPSVGWQAHHELLGRWPEDAGAGKTVAEKPPPTALGPECSGASSFPKPTKLS